MKKPDRCHLQQRTNVLCFCFVLCFFFCHFSPPKPNVWCESANMAASELRPCFSFLFFSDRHNLNITKSTCQKGRGGGRANTRTNLTQIYKNMPLELYQQLRIVGALFTEKALYTNIYNNTDFFSHMGMRRLQVAGRYSDNRMSRMR